MRIYPKSYLANVPSVLDAVGPPPSEAELGLAHDVRRPYLFSGEPMPYVVDIVRAMRLARGRRRYVEIGTWDKGNLAYLSTLLAPDAILVDVDVDARPEHTERLQRALPPGQRLVGIVGDSTTPAVVQQVRDALGGPADVVFIDGNHSAPFAWADYANYRALVAPGGIVMFHDIFWHGDETSYGVAHAMEWIDRHDPVWVVYATDPVHRYFPWLVKSDIAWGGVGIVLA